MQRSKEEQTHPRVKTLLTNKGAKEMINRSIQVLPITPLQL